MNMRLLSVLGLMALAVAVWFFYQEDAKIEPALPKAPVVESQASKIQGVQTDAQTGNIEYTLNADSLVQHFGGYNEMLGVSIDWYPPQGGEYALIATKARHNQETGDLQISEGFQIQKATTANKDQMIIKGEFLSGDTRRHFISSDQPVMVTQGLNQFQAQSFVANLQTGDYEFSQVQMLLNAAK